MNEIDVPVISPTDLKARLDNGDVLLLVDVRESFELAIADLPEYGQLRIPFNTGEFMQRMSEIDPSQEVVLYCRSGQRSEWAATLLMRHGHERVLNMTGGVLGWRAEVDPSLRSY